MAYSYTDSLNMTIPQSESPIPSVRASVHSLRDHSLRESVHSVKGGSTHPSMRASLLASQPGSVRESLEASIRSRTEQDGDLRQSVDEAEDILHENVQQLATLTLREKQRAISDQQQLDYYRRLEGGYMYIYTSK